MKHLKAFEEINISNPHTGDYVICYSDSSRMIESNINLFLSNNIGKVFSVDDYNNQIDVTYENIPDKLLNFFEGKRKISSSEENKSTYIITLGQSTIKHLSNDKQELEVILNTKKFNI